MTDLEKMKQGLPIRFLEDLERAVKVVVGSLRLPADEFLELQTGKTSSTSIPFSVFVQFPAKYGRTVAKVGHVPDPKFQHYTLKITDPKKTEDHKQRIEKIIVQQYLKQQEKRQKK